MKTRNLVAIVLCMLLWACGNVEKKPEQNFLKVEGQNFVDAQGRQVMLSGINFISKNKAENYMPKQGEETFRQFKNWGFNCIRLGIIWDGLEPEPGQYNEAYLQEIDKRIEWARANGMYVFLDMHQDLFSAKYADGAPEWATLDEGKPHYKGAVWSDSYMISPAVQTAFDNFWANKPAPDGIGVQDHLANLWKHIAKRYANNTTVIGYDILNEPFMGSEAQHVMPLMLTAYAKIYAEEKGTAPPAAQELEAMWADAASRMEALELIATREKYAKVVDAVYEISAQFERQHLQPMYQKVANAIRQVDPHHILFLNHNYFVNTGVSTALEPLKLADGSIDKQVAYAAHGYDLVVDTKEIDNPSYERVEFIFDRIAESGKRLQMPVLVGEWGALHGASTKLIKPARHLINLFEKHNFGNTYWAFYSGMADSPYFQNALVRPFPQAINGKLLSYDYNFESGVFECNWEESGEQNANSVIFVPNLSELSEADIDLMPATDQVVFEHFGNHKSGCLIISPSKKPLKRTLRFKMQARTSEDINLSGN